MLLAIEGRIGEITSAIPKAQTVHKGNGDAQVRFPPSGKSKQDVMKESNISAKDVSKAELIAKHPAEVEEVIQGFCSRIQQQCCTA